MTIAQMESHNPHELNHTTSCVLLPPVRLAITISDDHDASPRPVRLPRALGVQGCWAVNY